MAIFSLYRALRTFFSSRSEKFASEACHRLLQDLYGWWELHASRCKRTAVRTVLQMPHPTLQPPCSQLRLCPCRGQNTSDPGEAQCCIDCRDPRSF